MSDAYPAGSGKNDGMADEHDRTPSLGEWLAEYRSRPEPQEVVHYRVVLPEPITSPVPRQSDIRRLRIVRYDEVGPSPTGGFYLLSENSEGEGVSDTWHEELEEAFHQAQYEFGVEPSAWQAEQEGSE